MHNHDNNEEPQLEVLAPTALESITRGEIDLQIATARRYPRSMALFKKRALDMALIDEETAESCIYSRPVGMKDGKQQYAEGMSIRMAEIVGAGYGNIRVGSMIIDQTERMVKCRGMAHDLESNFASTSECIEATVTRNGAPFSENMRAVVAKACLAKAWRDALFKVVPRALCKPIETEIRKLMVGDAKSLEKRRAIVMQWVSKLGIDTTRVFAAIGIVGEEDIGTDQLMLLTGLKSAIKEGDTTIEEAFPPLGTNPDGAPKFVPRQKPAAPPEEKPQPPAEPTPSSSSTAAETPAPAPAGPATRKPRAPKVQPEPTPQPSSSSETPAAPQVPESTKTAETPAEAPQTPTVLTGWRGFVVPGKHPVYSGRELGAISPEQIKEMNDEYLPAINWENANLPQKSLKANMALAMAELFPAKQEADPHAGLPDHTAQLLDLIASKGWNKDFFVMTLRLNTWIAESHRTVESITEDEFESLAKEWSEVEAAVNKAHQPAQQP